MPKARHKGPEARHKGPKRETLAQSKAQRLEMEKPKGRECQKPEDQRVWRARARRARRTRGPRGPGGPEDRKSASQKTQRRPAGQKKRDMPEGEQEKNPVKQLATTSLSVTENQIPNPNRVESLASATI